MEILNSDGFTEKNISYFRLKKKKIIYKIQFLSEKIFIDFVNSDDCIGKNQIKIY